MPRTTTNRAFTFSLLAAVAFALQALSGVFVPGLYRDNTWVASVLRGTDVVALAIVLPLLLASHALARRGWTRWRLIWIGVLYKVFYNNLYLLCGAAFNRAFLLYVAVAVLSAFAVVTALLGTDAAAIDVAAIPEGHRKTASVILLGNAALLAVMWVGQSIMYVVTGKLPQLVVDGGVGTHLVASFDLAAIVPLLVLGAVWLWQSRPWGLVISAAMLVQCVLIPLDLVTTPYFQAAAGVQGAWAMAPLFGGMGGSFLVGAVLLLRSVAASPSTSRLGVDPSAAHQPVAL